MSAKHPPSLGEFLRARRERLTPEAAGLPSGVRRRTPGLRREEVAVLCGISPTWYTWIEQGRTTAVSVPTLDALARGLRLSQAERTYLFELSDRADPAPPRQMASPSHELQALVQAVRTPAYVLDHHWDALAWNVPAARHFAAWLGPRSAVPGRNLLRYVFTDPLAPSFIVGWAQRAERLVAEFRADTAAWRDDPVRQALVDELSQASAAFDAAWRSQRVLGREGGRRHFVHPTRGACAFDQHTLRVAEHAELKLTVLVPA